MSTDVQLELNDLVKASQKGFRVDVVELAKKLNIPVYSVDLSDEESGHIWDSEKPYIEVNRNHPVTRQRFTVAHELSHYLKHRSVLEARGQLDRKRQYDSPEEVAIETEADKMAAEILMPGYSVDEYFEQQNWDKLTRFTADMIIKLADEFRVSKEMAITRLRDLGFPIPYLTFA